VTENAGPKKSIVRKCRTDFGGLAFSTCWRPCTLLLSHFLVLHFSSCIFTAPILKCHFSIFNTASRMH